MSLPSGPKAGEIWSVGIDGGAPRLVGAGTDPVPSPRGDLLAFVHDGQPYSARASVADPPTPLFRDAGRVTDIAWSPDGTRIAFVSVRSQHSLVGVFDLASKVLSWISPGIDADSEPVWSPDGHRIAFLRTVQDQLPSYMVSHHDGVPWQIWIADAYDLSASAFGVTPGRLRSNFRIG